MIGWKTVVLLIADIFFVEKMDETIEFSGGKINFEWSCP
jgi:hypothetical protein